MARIWASLVILCFMAGAAQAAPESLPEYKTLSIDGPENARKIAVRVTERVNARTLYELAGDVNAKRKPGETIASVSFFLPKTDLAAQPWAIARFNNDRPDISILGLSAEEEALFRSEAQLDPRDVVGVWLTSPPALPGKLTVLKSKDGLIAEWHLRSGQKTYDKVTASRSSRGMRYTVVGGDGAYYIATRSGELLLGDATRIIAVAEKLPVDPNARLAAGKNHAVPGTLATAIAAEEIPATELAAPAARPSRVRPRRAAQTPGGKKGASVTELMGGAIAR